MSNHIYSRALPYVACTQFLLGEGTRRGLHRRLGSDNPYNPVLEPSDEKALEHYFWSAEQGYGRPCSGSGREWDTVIISICDCSANPKEKLPRFTSTTLVEEGATPGIKVLNTAISRAKKKLVVVCDADHWKNIEGELLAELVHDYLD